MTEWLGTTDRRECLRQLATVMATVLPGGLRMAEAAGMAEPTGAGAVAAEGLDRQFGAGDWPDFLGPDRDGSCQQPIRRRDWAGMAAKWQVPLGEGYGIGSSRDRRWVQLDRMAGRERTLCLDLDSGQVLWEQDRPTDYRDLYGYDGGPRCSPVLTQDKVFTYGADGVLIARRLQDGQELWRRDLSRDFHVVQNFFGVGSTPIVYGQRLWVMVGGSPESDRQWPPGALDRVSAAGSAMVAVDLETGETQMSIGDDLASYSSPIIATIARDPLDPNSQKSPVGLAFCRQGLLAFDPQTGRQHFHFPFRSRLLESVNAATPIVRNNQVLLSETYGVGSVLLELNPTDLADPRVVWQDDPGQRDQSLQAHWNTPVYHQGYVYASSGRDSGNAELRCVQWGTGKVMWRQPRLTRCSLTKAAGDDLVVLSERGDLFMIQASPQQYRRLTSHQFPEAGQALRYPAWAGVALAQEYLLCRDKSNLYCFEIGTP